MKPDDFANRFELYELKDYIIAKQKIDLLEAEYKAFEDSYYDDVPMTGTQYNYELGQVYCGSGCSSMEDWIIDMIEQKELRLKILNRMRKQEELFDLAMDALTPREKDVIQVVYFNRENNLGLSLEFFIEILLEALNKLCSFIGGERIKQRDEANKDRKIQLNKAVTKWAAQREVS
ncbi:MAG: hypothetical protein Q8934_19735 [Bacillota bacterium]|nr:hypothetical protein [Bacillota bacterium]